MATENDPLPLTKKQKVADFFINLLLFILCPSAYLGARVMEECDKMQDAETAGLMVQVTLLRKLREDQRVERLKWRGKGLYEDS